MRRLFATEAAALGLSFEEAVDGAWNDTLPHDPIGSDLRMLVLMLVRDEDDASLTDDGLLAWHQRLINSQAHFSV